MIRIRRTHFDLHRLVVLGVTIVVASAFDVPQVPAQCQTGEGLFDYAPNRDDALAEYLAMELSPALRAPDDEYDRIHRDLELIRAVFLPLNVLVTYRRYVPDKMLVRVDVDLPQDDYNQLNAFYQVIDDLSYTIVPGLHVLTFCDTLNIPTLVAEYEALPGVLYAEPDYYLFMEEVEPDDAVVTTNGTTYQYRFSRNVFDYCGGPCPCFVSWSGDVIEDGSFIGVFSWASGACVADCCIEGRGCVLADLDTCSNEGGTQVDECLDDGDGDGIDDACTAGSWPDPPRPELVPGEFGVMAPSTKNRFLSFDVPSNTTKSVAVRVTFVDIPPPYDLWNGRSMWVDDPIEVPSCTGLCGPGPPPPPFMMATLRCGSATYRNWSDVGIVHVHHEGIVPGATYRVEVEDEQLPGSFSEPLEMTTATYGDTVANLTGDPPPPPNGPPVRIDDALAILRVFISAPGAIGLPRADLEPACVDFTVNISDVLSSLRGFIGQSHPFSPSAADPCDVTCAVP